MNDKMDDLKVFLLQCDIFWNEPQKNFEKFENIIQTLNQPNLVVIPETFTTGFSVEDPAAAIASEKEVIAWFTRVSTKYDTALTGSVLVKDGDKIKNRMFFFTPDGKHSHYDKRHLFSMGKENKLISPGKERVVVEWMGWKIFLQVCYDLRFPVFSNNDLGYDIIIYTANWPAERIDHWTTLLKARAVENLSFVLGCNRVGIDGKKVIYNGNSMIIGPYGKTLAQAYEKENVLDFTLAAAYFKEIRTNYPFLKDIDKFKLLNL